MSGSGARPLSVGLFLPHLEGAFDGATAGWGDIEALARAAEDTGFDSVWIADHVLYRFPGVEPFGSWECWSLVTAVSAVTDRVEIGTMVSVTPWRAPGLLAKIIDTAEEISGGRIIAGLGAGSHEAEFPAFGFPDWSDRIDRFAEELEIITVLLRSGRIDHDGRFHRLADCELRPRGPRPQGPPVMVGAVGPRMLRLAAAHADLWNLPWRHDIDDVREQMRRVDRICTSVGRDPGTLGRTAALQVDVPGSWRAPEAGVFSQSRPDAIRGEAREVAERLRAYAEVGVTHVQLWLYPATVDAVRAFADVLAELDG